MSELAIYFPDLLNGLLHSVIYFVMGILILIIGGKVFDLITPYDLKHELAENDNVAVGITQAGFYIALGIIIHATVSGESYFYAEDKSLAAIFIKDMILTVSYFIVGLIALSLGRVILNKTMSFSIDKEIVEDKNKAVGLLEASFYITIALVIHASFS